MLSKAKAIQMNDAVTQYEEKMASAKENSGAENDTVFKELKEMFENGKELLRVNYQVLEQEKKEVAKMRQDLEHEKQELDKVKKQILTAEFLTSEPVAWNVDTSVPSWSQGHANLTIANSKNGQADQQAYQVQSVAPSGSARHHGSSRPPSRPGSKPGSRSQSIARESKGKSPAAFTSQVSSKSNHVQPKGHRIYLSL